MDFVTICLVIVIIILFIMVAKLVLGFIGGRTTAARPIFMMIYNIFNIPYSIFHTWNDYVEKYALGNIANDNSFISNARETYNYISERHPNLPKF